MPSKDANFQTRRLTSLIACEGRMIRVLEHARVTLSMEVESSPTVLHIYEDDDSRTVLFGTVDGKVGILDVERYKVKTLLGKELKLLEKIEIFLQPQRFSTLVSFERQEC